MRLLTPIVAVVVLLSLGACAQVKQSDSRPSGTAHEGSTVVVGPKEAGRNVTLHQGDRLVVVAGAKRRGRQWMLASFPRSLLNLRSSYLPRGRFEFLAAHTGAWKARFAARPYLRSMSGQGALTERRPVTSLSAFLDRRDQDQRDLKTLCHLSNVLLFLECAPVDVGVAKAGGTDSQRPGSRKGILGQKRLAIPVDGGTDGSVPRVVPHRSPESARCGRVVVVPEKL